MENATVIDGHPLDWLKSIPMRTQGEIEAAISEGISRFEQDFRLGQWLFGCGGVTIEWSVSSG